MPSVDSMVQRSQAAKAGTLDGDEPSKKQKGGKDIIKMLNLQTPPDRKLNDKTPLKMMDIVKQVWTGDHYYDPEEDEDIDEG